MIEVIVAVDKNYGIGNDNKLPWNIPEELKIFKNKTINNVVIFGSKTSKYVPKLENRIIYSLSRNNPDITIERIHNFHKNKPEKIFVAGGSKIYKRAFDSGLVSKIHISIIEGTFTCDTFFDKKWLNNFVIVEKTSHEGFTHYVMEYREKGEQQYLDILQKVLQSPIERNTRNAVVYSGFCEHLSFDLRKGFPLLTTKRMFWRGVVEELLFFLRGETDSKVLEKKNINIWKGNTSREFLDSLGKVEREEGLLGPMYGYQFRNYGSKYCEKTGSPLDKGIDQLEEVIVLIKNDPTSRRILMTSYNAEQAKEGCLYPCHSLTIQFYVDGEYLDMFCYNRSSDLFLGLPFNIASSALLLEIIAKATGYKARYFNLTLGDVHIYKSHIEPVKKQLTRLPYSFPDLTIEKEINSLKDIENLEFKDFNIVNYRAYNTIKAEMVA